MGIQGIKVLGKTIGGFVNKNSSTILTVCSVSGLFATTIFAVGATPKALRLIEDAEDEKGEVLTKKEVVKETYKCYIPAVAMGLATMACIIGAHSIDLRKNTAFASAYTLTENALKNYQSKVVETIGKAKEKEVKDAVAKDKVEKDPVTKKEVIITGKGETLCYDSMSGRYFKSDMEDIKSVLNDLSRRLMNDMYISLNEVYSELGLEQTKLGDMVGWHIDWGTIKPDFSSTISDDGRPCLVLGFEDEPRYCDRNY
jgi:hypothetical protein